MIALFAIAIMNTPLQAASRPIVLDQMPDRMETAETWHGHIDRDVGLKLSGLTDRPVGQLGCEPRRGKSCCCPACYLAIDNVPTRPWGDHTAGLFAREVGPQRDLENVFRPPKPT